MPFQKFMPYLILSAALLAPAAVLAQAGQPQTWAEDTAYLQQLSPAQAVAQPATLKQIRSDASLWIAAHPASDLTLAAAPAEPLTTDTAAVEIKELDRVVTAIVAKDPTHPFHLGSVTVNVTAPVTVRLLNV